MSPLHTAAAPDSLGAALVRAREEACLTQGELAERSGLSVRAIRNLETGHTARPRRQSLQLLAEALGLPSREAGRLLRLPRAGSPAAPPGAAVPAELPAAPRHRLVGRDALTAELTARLALTEPGHGRPAVVVGPPGAGKTSLVLRAAHEVRGRFPDGQVFVDLHRAASLPFTPDVLVRRILRSLGGTRAPENPEEARARLRDALSRRRVLVVLDNVDSEAQVRPLLVDDGRSAVLVAARRELSALPDGFHRRIGALDRQDAHRMLADLVGTARIRAGRQAARSVVESCAGLPLALHIAGLWLTARPHRSLGDLADRLADERERLRSLHVGDLSLHTSVTAYYRLLPPPLRDSLHRLQSVGDDFGVDQLLSRVTPSRRLAVDLLEELLHRQLAEAGEPDHGGQIRYRLHDAVRLYVAHGA
ncbi:NB-ARC domain-containing protein [Streptomyces sp. NPDC016566]|uniref:helix-turn-helix domain-containing protein n=1 Tax=unclassified Streptomyces TaxID=2593676 RepID=UPI0011AA2F4E|nr:helix-turn-helix domain-containing protein [Streptomyces sp. BK340]TVZ83687.1 helix-turn-helix protein [Streptomyces sp. BK340]